MHMLPGEAFAAHGFAVAVSELVTNAISLYSPRRRPHSTLAGSTGLASNHDEHSKPGQGRALARVRENLSLYTIHEVARSVLLKMGDLGLTRGGIR